MEADSEEPYAFVIWIMHRGHNLGSWGLTTPASAGAILAILEGWIQSLKLRRTGSRVGTVTNVAHVLQMCFHPRIDYDDTTCGPNQPLKF